jgi:hypothetical protein
VARLRQADKIVCFDWDPCLIPSLSRSLFGCEIVVIRYGLITHVWSVGKGCNCVQSACFHLRHSKRRTLGSSEVLTFRDQNNSQHPSTTITPHKMNAASMFSRSAFSVSRIRHSQMLRASNTPAGRLPNPPPAPQPSSLASLRRPPEVLPVHRSPLSD